VGERILSIIFKVLFSVLSVCFTMFSGFVFSVKDTSHNDLIRQNNHTWFVQNKNVNRG